MRTLQELTDVDDPAWQELVDHLRDADPSVEVLPVDPKEAEACLLALQVTTRSTLGALALHVGGVVVDHGWLRMVGGGHPGLPSLAAANRIVAGQQPPVLLVAFDVLGGRFAIDGGGLGVAPGEVCYWAPDSLMWQATGLGHTDFVDWALAGGPSEFYGDLRWDGWADEVRSVSLSDGLVTYPPLCAAEGWNIADTSRKAVPWPELTAYLDDLAKSLGAT